MRQNIIKKDQFIDSAQSGSQGPSYNLIGTTLQAVSVQLDEGESIFSEAGKMSWMTENIEFTTQSQGIEKMVQRFFTRETIFVNKFTCKNGTGVVTFSADQTGKIIPVTLSETSPEVIFQKGAYLCSEEGIDRSIAFVKRIGAGLFGGKGFILQKATGLGNVYLVADGEVVEHTLKEGQKIYIDQGNLVAYEKHVDFDIETVKGPLNWLFSGEGIFLATLKGPGKVWLQTRKRNPLSSYGSTQSTRNFNTNPLGSILAIVISGLTILGCIIVNILLR